MPESQTVTVQATAPPAPARTSGGEEPQQSPLLWRSALVGPRWSAVRFVFMLVSQLIELPCELQDGRSHPCIGLSCRHGAAPRGLFAVFSSKSHRPLDEWPHTIRNSVLDTRLDRLIHKSQFRGICVRTYRYFRRRSSVARRACRGTFGSFCGNICGKATSSLLILK